MDGQSWAMKRGQEGGGETTIILELLSSEDEPKIPNNLRHDTMTAQKLRHENHQKRSKSWRPKSFASTIPPRLYTYR